MRLTLRIAGAAPAAYRAGGGGRLGDLRGLSPGNLHRAKRAFNAVKVYAKRKGQETESLETNTTDLVADLMHLARWKELDWTKIDRMASTHFQSEVYEEKQR